MAWVFSGPQKVRNITAKVQYGSFISKMLDKRLSPLLVIIKRPRLRLKSKYARYLQICAKSTKGLLSQSAFLLNHRVAVSSNVFHKSKQPEK